MPVGARRPLQVTGDLAGIDSNIVTASFKAVLSAVNRQLAMTESVPVAATVA